MGLHRKKHDCCMRTKAQTSLHICAVWSGPLLFPMSPWTCLTFDPSKVKIGLQLHMCWLNSNFQDKVSVFEHWFVSEGRFFSYYEGALTQFKRTGHWWKYKVMLSWLCFSSNSSTTANKIYFEHTRGYKKLFPVCKVVILQVTVNKIGIKLEVFIIFLCWFLTIFG